MQNHHRSTLQAFTLVEIMIVMAIIGLLAAMAIPSYIRNRIESHRMSCINNLRQIDNAKEQAAMAYGWTNGTGTSDSDLTSYHGQTLTNFQIVMSYVRGTDPLCPSKGSYDFNPVGSNPVCSLTGDPNLHILQR